jgi:hypothetical protein
MSKAIQFPKFTAKAVATLETAAKKSLRKLVARDQTSFNGTRAAALKAIDEWHFEPTKKNAWEAMNKDFVIDTGIGPQTVVAVKKAFAGKADTIHASDLKGRVKAMNIDLDDNFST